MPASPLLMLPPTPSEAKLLFDTIVLSILDFSNSAKTSLVCTLNKPESSSTVIIRPLISNTAYTAEPHLIFSKSIVISPFTSSPIIIFL